MVTLSNEVIFIIEGSIGCDHIIPVMWFKFITLERSEIMRGKTVVSLLLVLANILSLCSCGGGSHKKPDSYEIPTWISDRQGTARNGEKSSPSGVNFYYDNTTSMYPFVCNAKGESSVKGRPAVSGTLVNWMSAVREILQQYDGVTYTLQQDSGNQLHWAPYQGDMRNNFSSRSFYTKDGEFPVDGDALVGPLAQLYYQADGQSFDPAAMNIVLTDLAEQSVNNTELAAHINRDILSQEGYAAAIIAVNCPFHGTAYVPNPDKISQLKKGKVDGKRPLYMILTGPEERLEMVYNALISAMNVQGMSEGQEYYTTVQSSKETVTAVSNDAIVIPPALAEGEKTSFKKYVSNSVFYDNFALELLNESDEANLFGSDSYLDVDVNVFDYAKAKGSDRMVLNYYIPLSNYGDNYLWRLAKDRDSDLKETDSQDAAEFLEKKDYLTYDYMTLEEVEVDPDASEEEEKEEKGDKKEIKRRRKKKSRSETQMVAGWYNNEADGQWTTLKNFEDSFSVEAKLLGPDDITTDVQNGAELYDKKGNYVDSTGDAPRGSKTYELDQSDELDLSSSDYWIHLQVENVTDSFDSSMVAFDLPIYAYIASNKTMPAWVDNLNVTAADADSPGYYSRTFNLTGFYSTLFGVNVQGNQELHQYECEVKIADIVTIINGLPSSKKGR